MLPAEMEGKLVGVSVTVIFTKGFAQLINSKWYETKMKTIDFFPATKCNAEYSCSRFMEFMSFFILLRCEVCLVAHEKENNKTVIKYGNVNTACIIKSTSEWPSFKNVRILVQFCERNENGLITYESVLREVLREVAFRIFHD